MIEKLPARETPKARYEKLTVRAENEITDELLKREPDTEELEAIINAQQRFDDRAQEAQRVYDSYFSLAVDTNPDAAETRNLAEGIVKEIARCFSLDGYISALTAQRLAASFVEMQPDKDGEKDEDGGDDGGEDGLIDWEPEE